MADVSPLEQCPQPYKRRVTLAHVSAIVAALCCISEHYLPFLQVHGVEGPGQHQPSGEGKPGLSAALAFQLKLQVLSQNGFRELGGIL